MPAVPLVLAVSGASAAIGAAAATAIGLGTVSAIAATAIGTGIVAGGMAAVQGGDVSDVLESAVKGGVTSFVGGTVASAVGGAVAEATGSKIIGAATGGAAGTLATGGDAQDILRSGLLSGAGAGISDYQQQLRQEQFDTGMTESGLAGQTLMDSGEQTVLEPWQQSEGISQLLNELSPYQQPYVLGANEVFAGPDGQPLPINNADQIAALEAAKGLAPLAINTILPIKSATQESEQTGFPILPIPSEWQSPVYNQEFTPSAPIDFGTLDLLVGTQWETPQQAQTPQPYTLTNLINTLNYQPVPFVPQQYDMPQQVSTADFMSQFQAPTVGADELIGNLGGKPVSIADIISGIQSQYG